MRERKKISEPMFSHNGEEDIFIDDGTPDGYYVSKRSLEKHICDVGGPNALSQIIMDWKEQNPDGTKEQFMRESHFSQETTDNLWDYF